MLMSALHRRGHDLSGVMGNSQGLKIMIRKASRLFRVIS